jgi:NAD(P)-dependent dehydrogenase (short-subunit alcohol dehydrogenase family)
MGTTAQSSGDTAALGSVVATVTGGSRGIGFAIAAALVSKGAKVAITGRSQPHLDTAVADLTNRAHGGGAVHAIRSDVSQPEAAARAVEETVARFGGLDVLVNNAGIGAFAKVADLSVDDWKRVIETNLGGVFYCSHAAIPHLKRRGAGWIINISSLAGKNPFVGGAAYCASKAGLNAFSEALMQEVRYDNIRVSYIMPGSVSTDFNGPGGTGTEDWKIAPEDIADIVLDLITFPPRSLPSRIEIRPSRPKKSS